jgi:tRNA dimethylallyltransferase
VKPVFLLGPTASGKTAVALALAERFPVEIVSVDSVQVYRGMDIGTAKPDAAERARVPHHLIDIIDPTEAYSAGRFRADALRVMREIESRGRIALFTGGTMLYYRALTSGLAELPAAQPAIRAELENEARIRGWPALHGDLAKVDPAAASRIEPTDAQRIQRALEVHRHSGKPLSSFHAEPREAGSFEAITISLEPSDRAVLHARIAERFRSMLARGLVAELEALRARYALHAGLSAMRAVGYRQAWDVLEGSAPPKMLEARGTAATRQLAKRQLTWLRAMTGLERLDCLRPDLANAAANVVERSLSRRRGT